MTFIKFLSLWIHQSDGPSFRKEVFCHFYRCVSSIMIFVDFCNQREHSSFSLLVCKKNLYHLDGNSINTWTQTFILVTLHNNSGQWFFFLGGEGAWDCDQCVPLGTVLEKVTGLRQTAKSTADMHTTPHTLYVPTHTLHSWQLDKAPTVWPETSLLFSKTICKQHVDSSRMNKNVVLEWL